MKTETRERTKGKGVMCVIAHHASCPGSRYNEDTDWECTCECHYGPWQHTCTRCQAPVEWRKTERGALWAFNADASRHAHDYG